MVRRKEFVNDLERAAGAVERASAPAREVAGMAQKTAIRLGLIAAATVVAIVGLIVLVVAL